MGYEVTKEIAKSLRLYRPARWVNRHVINRQSLRLFREEIHFYSQLVGHGDLCFDVGANNGVKAEVLLRLGATVVAFEPQRECREEMFRRLGRDRCLTIVGAALASQTGTAEFFVNPERTASSFVRHWQGESATSVIAETTTLDEAITAHGIPKYCKIDVEGFEVEVIKGLSHQIPLVSFEYHLSRPAGKAAALECLDRLGRFGDILVNICAAERPKFARPNWVRRPEFTEILVHQLSDQNEFCYGDIFVKYA